MYKSHDRVSLSSFRVCLRQPDPPLSSLFREMRRRADIALWTLHCPNWQRQSACIARHLSFFCLALKGPEDDKQICKKREQRGERISIDSRKRGFCHEQRKLVFKRRFNSSEAGEPPRQYRRSPNLQLGPRRVANSDAIYRRQFAPEIRLPRRNND